MSNGLVHYVSRAPFDPTEIEALTPEQEQFYMASQWRMMWWRLKRHRVAVIAGIVLILSYCSIIVTEFLAPYDLHSRHTEHIYAPPQGLHLFHEGRFVGPFVYGLTYRLDMENLKRVYTPDTRKPQVIRYFCDGDEYEFWG